MEVRLSTEDSGLIIMTQYSEIQTLKREQNFLGWTFKKSNLSDLNQELEKSADFGVSFLENCLQLALQKDLKRERKKRTMDAQFN
jgi:hypothetical protein